MSKVLKKLGKRLRRDSSASSSSHDSPTHSTSSHHSNPPLEEPEVEPTPLPRQPRGETLGIIFVDENHVNRYFENYDRKIVNTRLYHKEDMKELGVHTGIATLFKNIGWQGFLDWVSVGFERPTLEFTCSCRNRTNNLAFRMFNRNVSITVSELCLLANAPTENTINPYSRNLPPVEYATFWRDITGLDEYNPRHLKTSCIRHPVLRLAARLITSAIACREEAGTINSTEFFILWCMVHSPDVTPNFGEFIRHNLIKNATTTKTTIHYSSIITIIINSRYLQIAIPRELEPFQSDPYLSKAHLMASRIVKFDSNANTYTWQIGNVRGSVLVLRKRDFKRLSLKKNVIETDWLLGNGASGSGTQHQDTPVMDPPATGPSTGSDPPATGPSTGSARHSDASFFSTYQHQYEQLHSDYLGLHEGFTNLHSDYSALHGGYSSLRTDLSHLQNRFNVEAGTNTLFRNEVREYMTQSRAQQNSMHDMINSLFNWGMADHPDAPRHPPSNP